MDTKNVITTCQKTKLFATVTVLSTRRSVIVSSFLAQRFKTNATNQVVVVVVFFMNSRFVDGPMIGIATIVVVTFVDDPISQRQRRYGCHSHGHSSKSFLMSSGGAAAAIVVVVIVSVLFPVPSIILGTSRVRSSTNNRSCSRRGLFVVVVVGVISFR
jgi:hypothetical protein